MASRVSLYRRSCAPTRMRQRPRAAHNHQQTTPWNNSRKKSQRTHSVGPHLNPTSIYSKLTLPSSASSSDTNPLLQPDPSPPPILLPPPLHHPRGKHPSARRKPSAPSQSPHPTRLVLRPSLPANSRPDELHHQQTRRRPPSVAQKTLDFPRAGEAKGQGRESCAPQLGFAEAGA